MVIEPIVLTSHNKRPNPALDSISALWILIDDDRAKLELKEEYKMVKIIVLIKDKEDSQLQNIGIMIGMQDKVELKFASSEIELIQTLIDLIQKFDPDILMGYEMLYESIGFILKRCQIIYELDISNHLSRTPYSLQKLNFNYYIMKSKDAKVSEEMGRIEESKYYYFDLSINGRVLYNVIDKMKLSLHLKNYDLDSVAFHLLQQREPKYSYDTLTEWYK